MPERSSDQPAELTIRVGEEAIVPLGGAGSVGYGWTWQLSGDTDAVKITLKPMPPPVADLDPRGIQVPRGGSRTHRLAIHALKPGRVTIHLSLGRAFEPDRPPRERLTITTHVVPAPSSS